MEPMKPLKSFSMQVQQVPVQQIPVMEEKPMVSPYMMPYQQPVFQQPVYQQPVSQWQPVSTCGCHQPMHHKPKYAPVAAKAAPCSSPGEILVLFILLVIISRAFLNWR